MAKSEDLEKNLACGLSPDQGLNSAVLAFEQFIKQLRELEQILNAMPERQRRVLGNKLETRLSSKVLEGAARSNSVFEVLQNVLRSVQEINDILVGTRPVPNAPEAKLCQAPTEDEDEALIRELMGLSSEPNKEPTKE